MLTYSPAAMAQAAPTAQFAQPASHAAGNPSPGARPDALNCYRRVDLESRVASASPHALVLMLFERLQWLLREAAAATDRGETVARCRLFEKALALVDGLDMTLDDARGGEVARTLHRAYALMRARIAEGSAESLAEAGQMADALADAWRRIGPAARG
jgi:flagellar protein FliS